MKMTSSGFSYRVKAVGAVFLVLCFCLEYVRGGCLSYGHSCWGGHGKRSGPPPGSSGGRPAIRSIPAPPLAPNIELWPTIERMKGAAGGTGALYGISGSGYYQPLDRLYRLPPAAVIDLLNSDPTDDSSASSENEINPSKPLDDNSDGSDVATDHEPLRPRGDGQLQQRQRQPRRKSTIFETATTGKQQQQIPSDDVAAEDDIGRMLLEAAVEPPANRDLLKLLNSTPPRRYE